MVEIPTPIHSCLHEASALPLSVFKYRLLTLATYLFFPASLLLANRVIQYAPDSSYFTFLIHHKTTVVGNGILVNSLSLRRHIPPLSPSDNHLCLCGVAHVHFWHGYDRVIHAINIASTHGLSVSFSIAGNGPEILRLQQLVRLLNLQARVNFLGQLSSQDLAELYNNMHIAIGSIGVHRKSLASVSSLKVREYCATGIPFISSAHDPDFPNQWPYRFKVSTDDAPLDLCKAYQWYSSLSFDQVDARRMRSYASRILDWNHKVESFLQ